MEQRRRRHRLLSAFKGGHLCFKSHYDSLLIHASHMSATGAGLAPPRSKTRGTELASSTDVPELLGLSRNAAGSRQRGSDRLPDLQPKGHSGHGEESSGNELSFKVIGGHNLVASQGD